MAPVFDLWQMVWTPLPLEVLGLNAFSHPWTFQLSYMFPPPALIPLVLSRFLAEHVNSQLRHLILVVPCWMEAPWLPTILNMLADIPQQFPVIKDLIVDVSVCQVLKGLQYLHITLWQLSDVLCRQGFSSLVCQAVEGTTRASTSKVYQQCWKEWTGGCARQGLPISVISAPKLANFLLHLFQVGLTWHTIGIYHSAISAFLQLHWLHKAFTHPIISKLMCHFYLQHPPSHAWFDPWDVEHLLCLLESWAPASSLTTFKLAWKTATLLGLVTAKHCSDLTLLCIDNQDLFLQCNAAIFIPQSGGKTDHPGHLPPQVHIESYFKVNICPVFIWRLIWDILNHLGQSQMDHLWLLYFWVTIGSIGLSVLNHFFLGKESSFCC